MFSLHAAPTAAGVCFQAPRASGFGVSRPGIHSRLGKCACRQNKNNGGPNDLAPPPSKLKLMLLGDSARQFEQPILDRFPTVETVVVSPRDIGGADLAGVRCAIGWNFPDGAFANMPDLEWIQSISVGVENWVYDSNIPPGVVITNAKGLYSIEVAEYVTWAMLTLFRRFHLAMRNQQKKRWSQQFGHSLAGKTVGIVGMGHLGQATARNAKALGMRVVGFCRNADDPDAREVADKLVASSEMHGSLAELDALVICLPLTDETRGMFGRDEIAALKQGAIVINVARDLIVDYDSLLRSIKSGHIAGAALDVFGKEPLPRRSRLWKEENVLVTPHVAALTKDYKAKVSDLICTNLDRFLSGRQLQGMVDRTRGY